MPPAARPESNTPQDGRIYLHFCTVGRTLLEVENHKKIMKNE